MSGDTRRGRLRSRSKGGSRSHGRPFGAPVGSRRFPVRPSQRCTGSAATYGKGLPGRIPESGSATQGLGRGASGGPARRGYAEGRNLVWELRVTDGSLDQLPQFAEELVRLKVDLILARASSGAMAAKRATTSIPIVFFAVYAPVEIGLVPSLGHPGGDITGTAVNASDMAGKRVQLLKELVPTLKRVAILSHPSHPSNAVQLEGAEAVARALGVQLEAVPVRSADDFASGLKALTRHRRRLARRYPTLHRRTVLGSSKR